jgi:hypothetical protein
MRDLFPGHYKPTEAEFEQLWQSCIFSFDTNILLNVYRYTPRSGERLFEIWQSLNNRIWLPHQVAYEYHQERLQVISHQFSPYIELQKILNDSFERFTKEVESYSKRHSFSAFANTEQLTQILDRAHNKIKEILNESSSNYPNLLEDDIFLKRISQVFDKKVGQPYSEEDFAKHCKEAGKRFEQRKPPGYKDAKKNEPERYGDVVIWLQLIDHAKSEQKPIVFVTDDEKEDWWLEHKGKTLGPRPELIQEMLEKAGVAFYLYTGDRFLEYAASFLKLEDEPEIVEEAKDVRHQEEAENIVHLEIDDAEVRSLDEPNLERLKAVGLNEPRLGLTPELLKAVGLMGLKLGLNLDPSPEFRKAADIIGIKPFGETVSLGDIASSITRRNRQGSNKARKKADSSNSTDDVAREKADDETS